MFWQIMGFVFPFIGLLVFIIPIFVFWGAKQEEVNFDAEEHEGLRAMEEVYKDALIAEQNKMEGTPMAGIEMEKFEQAPKAKDDLEPEL